MQKYIAKENEHKTVTADERAKGDAERKQGAAEKGRTAR